MPDFDINYVAHLARLELSEQEKETLSHQLTQILAYVEKLKELDVSGVEPTAHAATLHNVLREDVARSEETDRELYLCNAPEQARGLFIVPKIVE
ncbi:MAG: Asp-tRNA(Asn)/Glu-tRNA(Gln) amidotransferase subunit GatC [Verrucomicrobiae bacterium]|nr:Asp-tRNA(Asn)/Glu-tRNA(Gln) amidotransferase subunit GatC [Verrucomicrobiae bacterium]